LSPLEKRLPKTPDGVRIYAIGDVHGRADLLARLFAGIDDDIAAFPAPRVIEILVGDYIDRGPQSRDVIGVEWSASKATTRCPIVNAAYSRTYELVCMRRLLFRACRSSARHPTNASTRGGSVIDPATAMLHPVGACDPEPT
jgi:Calcineurin-like phosphoesterase